MIATTSSGTPIVIHLAPDQPTPPGYVPVAHKTGVAAVLPDPNCNRCKGSPRYRYQPIPRRGEKRKTVPDCCVCVTRRLDRALAAKLPAAEAVEGPVVTGAEPHVVPVVERDHGADERRLTALRAQLAGVEGRLAFADAAHAGELARIDGNVADLDRQRQVLADEVARLDAEQDRHFANAEAVRTTQARLRAEAARLLRLAEELDQVRADAQARVESLCVDVLRAEGQREQLAEQRAEALAVRGKVVHRHERRTRNAREDAARLREKLAAAGTGTTS